MGFDHPPSSPSSGSIPPLQPPSPSLAMWEAQAQAELRGASVASLERTLASGWMRRVIYASSETPVRSASGPFFPTQSLQDVSGVDADATLRAVADALTRGESRILLRAERRAHDRRTGVHADPGYVEKLADALVGTACEVTLFRSRPGGAINGMDPRLETQLTAAGVALRVSYDPFLGVAQGLLHEDAFDVAIQNGIDALERRWVQEIWLSTEAVHEAGGDASVELGYLGALAVSWLDAAKSQGKDKAALESLWSAMRPRILIGGDFLLDIVKLRTARYLGQMLAAHFGFAQPWLVTTAQASLRNDSSVDRWNNLLRGTTAAMSGMLGGASALSLTPFDAVDTSPSALGRRMASNTIALLARESHLSAVADPVAGAYLIEQEGEVLAKRAISDMQQILEAGGVKAQLQSGSPLLEKIAASHRAQVQAYDQGIFQLVGSNAFATDDAGPLDTPEAAVWPDDDSVCPPVLPARRIAETLEALRLSVMQRPETDRPGIFVLGIGPLAQWTAKQDFVRDFAMAGAICVYGGDVSGELEVQLAALQELRAASRKVAAVVLCAATSVEAETYKKIASDVAALGIALEWAGAPSTVAEGLEVAACVHRKASRSEAYTRWQQAAANMKGIQR